MGGCGDSLVMISVQQFPVTGLIQMQTPCQNWQCLLSYVLQASVSELQLLQQDLNGTQSTLERVHLSQEFLPLKWPWKINLASCLWFLVTSYSCRCSWNAVAPPQSFHNQNRLQAPRSGSHSVFHVPRRAHPQSRGQDSLIYLTSIEHYMHGALGSGQAWRNGQNMAIVSRKLSLLGGRQSSQYYVCHIVEPCDRLPREQEGVSYPVGTEGLSIPFVRY